MKIKQIINSQVNSFEFSLNLLKGNYLHKILSLFGMHDAYICLYDLENRENIINVFHSFGMTQCKIVNEFGMPVLVAQITVESFISNWTKYQVKFSEMLIWSCETSWLEFIHDMEQSTSSFLTFRKNDATTIKAGFFLRFSPYDFNQVEIICEQSFCNAKSITKKDLLNELK